MSYNAYEKDIAIVNIFFGESTVFGKKHDVREGLKNKSVEFRT